ncbi:tetratricopeptide repeat protein [Kitasatospora sp. KL5]|uniref:tetratricopeptide repeat protein n=1 Tax=Kitasatospora sp. KL5 TaxID=3425125 RepID=UPI003D701104
MVSHSHLGTNPEQIPTDLDQRAALYRAQLAARTRAGERVLVLADNASTAAQVQHLTPAGGPHRLLITSRDDFATTLGARLVDLDVLTPKRAVTLMDTALRLTLPKDERIAADPDGAAKVADLCGHLPLALRIATAQLTADRALKPGRLAEDLQDLGARLDLLEDGDRAVRAVLERSYRRLAPIHAELFRLLAVNPGPDLSTDTATAFTAVGKLKDVRARLVALSRASLIRQDPDTGRWRMHDLVRAYATEQAAQHSAHTATALRRLLEHYTLTARDADAHLNPADAKAGLGRRFASRTDALAWLDAEHPNLVAAVHAAHTADHHDIAQALPAYLGHYLGLRRRLEDHLDVAQTALSAARDTHNPAGEANAWNNLGGTLRALWRFVEAEHAHREAIAWDNLGLALWQLQRFEEAEHAHRTALTQFRNLGDQHREAIAWDNLGAALWQLQRFEEAEHAHRTALRLYQNLGNQHREAIAWDNLGLALQALRRYQEAEHAHRTALTQFRNLGDQHREASAWTNLGAALWGRGEVEAAVEAGERAVALFEGLGDQYRLGEASDELADSLLAAGRPAGEVRGVREASAAAYRRAGAENEAVKALEKTDE